MKKKIILILFLIISIFFINIPIQASEKSNLVNIYFFHSNTCSHCQEEQKLLKKLEERYDNIKIYEIEIHDKEKKEILQIANTIYNLKTNAVPLTIIGNRVYNGFSTSKSSIKFIKTIEYYSRYGYIDKLGEQLNLELPTYELNANNPSLEEFLNSYHNYNLLTLKTDNLDTSSIAIILSLLSTLNFINIINIILILLLLKKIKNYQNKIISIGISLLIKIILFIIIVVNNLILTTISYLILIAILIISLIKIIKKRKEYIMITIMNIATIIITNIQLKIDNNIDILKNILNLHNLEGIDRLSYFSNFIIMTLLINLIIIWLIYILIKYITKLIETRKKLMQNRNDKNI